MCIFCDVVTHTAPARIVFEDDQVVAFHDVQPQAPTHLLVIPRKHIASLNEADGQDQALLGHAMLAARRAAQLCGLAAKGYRLVLNTGPLAGQSVHHMHIHVLGGRAMRWPPG